jgi:hypothetical protein
MVNSVIAFGTIVGLNLAIGVVLYIAFVCYRKRRTKAVDYSQATEDMELPPPPLYEESTYESLKELMSTVRNTSDDDIVNKVGVEALLYLKLQRLLVVMMNVFAVLGVAILCPIYYLGTEGDTVLEQLSIVNIAGDEILGAAPAVILVIFSLIAYILIYKYV